MRNCFVCMPLIEDLRPIYYKAILKEVEALGGQCDCTKADDSRKPGMVTEKVAKSMLNSDLVIAVIHDPRERNSINPNVMYELGIAHSFRKPTIVVADSTDGLPFDIHDVETIQLEFARFREEKHREAFLDELREVLRRTLKAPELLSHSNPVTTQLSGTQIFIEDLPWLWGYRKVLEREREAQTIWEITKDLYWPAEPLFFASIKAAIRDRRKHYFMVPEGEGVRRKVEAIKKQLRSDQIADEEIDQFLCFLAIDPKYFDLWPIAIVLYDADLATKRGGIICEPMTSEVGHDSIDFDIQRRFTDHVKSGGSLDTFQVDLDWVQSRREATFDIMLDGRVVDALATSFAHIWNDKILEQAKTKTGDEQSALLKTWLIGA
jgi:nucleoside 2-deoxyribosyltransferase